MVATIDRVVLLAAVLAAVPVLVATAHTVDAGWVPSSDDGMIALRAFDVLSTHPPLVGQYSQSSPLIDETTYSLGPMLYWLLAVPAHFAPRAIPVAMATVNVASVVGAVILAGRRGGRLLALVTALALVLLSRALPVETGYEVWNCWAGLFPFTFLLFLAWSVASGEHRLLPLLAVVASWALQVHFTYLVPAFAATAVAVIGLVVYARARGPLGARPWVIAALVATAVCWSAPLVDQAVHRPGNLVLAYRLATDDHETVGLDTGLRTTVHAIGVPPWWMRPVRNTGQHLVEPLLHAPAGSAASAILIVAGLIALFAVAWRRREHQVATATGLALAVVLSVLAVAASVPVGSLGLVALAYTLEWTVAAGMFVWIALGWSAWVLLHRTQVRVGGALAAAGLASVAAVSVLVAAGRDYDDRNRFPPGVKDYRLVDATTNRVVAALGDAKGAFIDVPAGVRNSLTFQSAIAYALRRDGFAIGVPKRLVREVGTQYQLPPDDIDEVILIRDPGEPPVPGSRTVVRNRAVSVMLHAWSPSPSKSSAP